MTTTRWRPAYVRRRSRSRTLRGMSVPAREPVPELDAEDALHGVVNQLTINGQRMTVIIPGSVIEALRAFSELVAYAEKAGFLRMLLLRAMPWATPLPESGMDEFASELADAAASGDHAPERLAAVLREGRGTAGEYAHPIDAGRPPRGLWGARAGGGPPWGYDEVSPWVRARGAGR